MALGRLAGPKRACLSQRGRACRDEPCAEGGYRGCSCPGIALCCRTRGAPNAARTLDVDLIAYGREIIDEPGLIVPHPRTAQRRFVMGPLAEIAPDWRHPVLGETATALAAKAEIGADARPLAG